MTKIKLNLPDEVVADIEQKEDEIHKLYSEIRELKGPRVRYCGFCYQDIADHKEYPTYSCYEAVQVESALSEVHKEDGRWRTNT